METLALVRNWVAPYVGESGKSPDSPETLEAINEARRVLYPLGDWAHTLSVVALQSYNGNITLPFWADTIKGAWNCLSNIPVQDGWYQGLSSGWGNMRGMDCQDHIMDMGDSYASFKDPLKDFRIKVIPQDNRDNGVELSFHGVSEYGEPVLVTRVLGRAWIPVISDSTSDHWLKFFTACQKPVTHGRIQVFFYDPVNDVNTLCAIYEAQEVNPRYRRYRMDSRCSRQIIARVKKKFIDLVNENDLVDIHVDALIHALQAVTARRNRDMNGYSQHIASARNFLDKEIESRAPTQTHVLNMSYAFRNSNLGFGEEDGCSRY